MRCLKRGPRLGFNEILRSLAPCMCNIFLYNVPPLAFSAEPSNLRQFKYSVAPFCALACLFACEICNLPKTGGKLSWGSTLVGTTAGSFPWVHFCVYLFILCTANANTRWGVDLNFLPTEFLSYHPFKIQATPFEKHAESTSRMGDWVLLPMTQWPLIPGSACRLSKGLLAAIGICFGCFDWLEFQFNNKPS